MKGIDSTLKSVIPCYGAVKTGMEQVQKQKHGSSKKKNRGRLTEVSRGSVKPVLCQNVTVNQAAKKLYDYEETGLAPYEVRVLMEREKALTEQVKKMQDW